MVIFTRNDLIERIMIDLRIEKEYHGRFMRLFLRLQESDFIRIFEKESGIKLNRLIKNRYTV